MATFKITETYEIIKGFRTIVYNVEADSMEEALSKIENVYDDDTDIVELSEEDDIQDVEFLNREIEKRVMKILIGEFTFVEPQQRDYEDLYNEFYIDELDLKQDRPPFCIIHKITESIDYTEEAMNRVEDEGLGYLILSKYNGLVTYK